MEKKIVVLKNDRSRQKSNFVFCAFILIALANPAWSEESKPQPDLSPIEKQRAEACQALQNNQFPKAVTIFKQIVDQNPEDAQANMDYGGLLFASASQYYTRGQTPAFSSEAMPILKESSIYLEKAARMFNTKDSKDKLLKSQACYLLGDIYHYGLVSLSKAKDDYQMAISLFPENKTAQNELVLIEKEEQKK